MIVYLFILILTLVILPLGLYILVFGTEIDWGRVWRYIKYGLPLTVAFFGSIWLLNYLELLEMSAGAVLFRIWPTAFIVLGIRELLMKDTGENKSAMVFLVFGGFFLILNMAFYFTDEESALFSQIVGGLTLLFWPALIIVVLVTIMYSDTSTGDDDYGID